MRFGTFAVVLTLWTLCLLPAWAAPKGGTPAAPTGVTATQGDFLTGIQIAWTPVDGATSYRLAVYDTLFATSRLSTISIGNISVFLDPVSCGVYRYYEVIAVSGGLDSPPSARVFGFSPRCGEAVQSCDYEALPLSGTGSYTFTTVGSSDDYRIGDRPGPCSDGNDPGSGGIGPDQVYTYVSPVDCTLNVSLTELDDYLGVLYIADTCEVFACDYYDFVVNGSESLTVPVTAGQSYYIFVDAYGGGSGQYTLDLSSEDCTPTTSCANPVYGFDSGDVPGQWNVTDVDLLPVTGVGRYAMSTWRVLEDLAGSGFNRVVAAYADPTQAELTDDWLTAGPFEVGEDATLTWRDARAGGTGGTLGVKAYVATGSSIEAFLAVGSVAALTATDVSTSYTTRSIPLAAEGFANQTIYVGFRHRSSQSGYFLLDDIGICNAEAETVPHTSDQDNNGIVNLSELLRVIQFYNTGALQCGVDTEDGFAPGAGNTACDPHASDYAPQNWVINLSELLRLIQFYNTGAYHPCETGEDGYCPGVA